MLRTPRHFGGAAIALAAVVLVVIWRVMALGSPPIYDGLCSPESYRLLGQSPPPSSASTTYSGESFPAAEVQTGESPPQAQVLMMAGTFTARSTITVSVTPEAPPAPPPAAMVQDGNAYRIRATSAGQELQPGNGTSVTIALRGSGASASSTMYARNGANWQALRTFNLGCGLTFEAVSTKLGEFALFRSQGARPGSSGFPGAAIVGVLATVIVMATLGLARLSIKRRRG